jgi:hypothetical protein
LQATWPAIPGALSCNELQRHRAYSLTSALLDYYLQSDGEEQVFGTHDKVYDRPQSCLSTTAEVYPDVLLLVLSWPTC